ncbi:Cdc25 phosphatase Ibp1 [Coemansia sp. RSA 1813]|nr:Cdc25 phosphatase Ibp1 [Coemansia sp. RSA 1646]KAJ1765651.1 Cdc25 phosphatase Ibp1 [Coemansia sp. RSA 1843]KAJ2085323.1 Cdc25 phosphatase Ibp1 [Coemansia sp. RSA 986]KAJ2210300.1 Cdc25 phosphatase Ibp1 [Coemansia sp. RSA 487]KAJ2562502.1 Cdc25 phosphatase Ibp1 [Coemansia sp. RSA 1813]
MQAPERLAVDDLASLVRNKDKTPGVDYVIVDVRDEDYKVGHIPGAINVPAHEMRASTTRLLKDYGAVPMIVFHCALSQVRGPKSARIYNEALAEALETAEPGSPLFSQSVYILTGGFTSWVYRFRNTEPELITEFSQQLWNAENY